MLLIDQTQDSGYTVYKFEANNTKYEVLTTDGVEFMVFSQRIGRTGRPAPKVYDSLVELGARSAAFLSLACFIGFTPSKAH